VASIVRALDRAWMAPAPAERLATVRVLVGAYAFVYLIARVPVLADFSRFSPSRFEPVAVVKVLSGPLPAALVWALWAACVVAAAAFALGWRHRWTGPLFAALFLWVTSYRNSWGMIFHTENLVALHAIVLGLSAAADARSLDAGRASSGDGPAYGWPLRAMSGVTASTYVLAGLAKLRESGLHWAEGDILRNYIAYDTVRKIEIDSWYSPFGAWLVGFEAPFPVIGVLTFVMELGPPLAFLHWRLRYAWVASAFAFHWGVLAIMMIAFPYPLLGLAYLSFLPCERIWHWKGLRWVERWLPGPAPSEPR